jgi:hypothetical protein
MSSPRIDITGPEASEEAVEIKRRTLVKAVSEDMALIAEREVTNWCKRCREFRMPLFSDENWAGVSLGIAAGLAGAWWASDFTDHPDREFALQFGIVIFLVVAAGLALKARSQRRKTETDLAALAGEMEGACRAGLVQVKKVFETPESVADTEGTAPR